MELFPYRGNPSHDWSYSAWGSGTERAMFIAFKTAAFEKGLGMKWTIRPVLSASWILSSCS